MKKEKLPAGMSIFFEVEGQGTLVKHTFSNEEWTEFQRAYGPPLTWYGQIFFIVCNVNENGIALTVKELFVNPIDIAKELADEVSV